MWFQNKPIETDIVRSDRFCCRIALTIAVQNLCAVLLSHFFGHHMRLLINKLNLSRSHAVQKCAIFRLEPK